MVGMRRFRLTFVTPATMKSEFGLWRSLASALAWGARGPGFKSRQPDQISYRLSQLKSETYVVESNLESIPWTP
jgi:hypothetical protein